MRVVILLSVLLLAVSVNSKTGFYHSPSLNCSFEYPLEWQIDTSQANSIVIKENDAINIKIIKHYLGDDEIMRSESDLYEGITGLYNDLGIVINEDDDINYQVFDGYAEFDINFIKVVKDDYVRNYLKGIVLNNINNQQIFYFMIAESPKDDFGTATVNFDIVLESFRFEDVISDNLYIPKSILPYLEVLLILALAAFFYARNRRVQKSKNPLGADSGSHWRCPNCRKVNHVEFPTCSRCGYERDKETSPEIKS